MIKKLGYSLFLFGVLFLISCEQEREPCLQPTIVPLRIAAKKVLTDSTFVDTLLPKPIWRPVDTLLPALIFGAKTSRFNILLSPHADSCRYALQPDSLITIQDTITFYYLRKLQFVSTGCGFTYFYSLQQLKNTNYSIKSVRINNSEVTSNANTPEHVQIFF